MSRVMFVIRNTLDREKVAAMAHVVRPGTRVEFKQSKRTLEQNALMWALLTEVGEQVRWDGKQLSPEDWKLMFLDGLKRETRTVPNLDRTGMVQLGRSSSDLSVGEMSDLVELIYKFGAEYGVKFSKFTEE